MKPLTPHTCILGEGPFWDTNASILYWVDIEAHRAFKFEHGEVASVAFPDRVTFIIPHATSGFMVGLGGSIAHVGIDWEKDSISIYNACLLEPEGIRMNDAKCDPQGRLWAGSMSYKGIPKQGSLYSYGLKGDFRQQLTGISISNGLCWRDDVMYYIDTPTKLVMAYQYSPIDGSICSPSVAVDLTQENAWPDGMSIDESGLLWIAMYGGACVLVCNPNTGEIVKRIPVPALNVTSCCFGEGVVYITTARQETSPKELAQYPLAGAVFVEEVSVAGGEVYVFGAM